MVPKSLQKETISRIHEGHQGVDKYRLRVRDSVWWPGVTSQVQQFVENCRECAQEARLRKEPLIPTPLPDYPWQTVAADLFELKGAQYLLVVDYFSRYPEVYKLASTTSDAIIKPLKSIFARHGVPEVLRSDNGPQFASREFQEFAKRYGFQHNTSSPHYPQSNGQVERMVRTIKGMLKKTKDLQTVLLSYRSTPMPWCERSPAELCMGRRVRTGVPQANSQLVPTWTYLPKFRKDSTRFKRQQKLNYDRRHAVKEQTTIPEGTEVVITTEQQPVDGRVVRAADSPHSYDVETESGEVRRNRSHLTRTRQPNSRSTATNGGTPKEDCYSLSNWNHC